MAEGARLESVYTGNCIEGSNPSPSASPGNQNLSPPFLRLAFSHPISRKHRTQVFIPRPRGCKVRLFGNGEMTRGPRRQAVYDAAAALRSAFWAR